MNGAAPASRPREQQGVAERLANTLAEALSRVAEWMIALLTLLFTYEVVMRYVFTRPSAMADQLGALMMPAITFLALARTYRDGAHVNVDILVNRLRPGARRWVQTATEALTLMLSAFLTWYAFRTVFNSYEEEERLMLGLWNIPLYLPQAVMPIGLALLTLQIAVSLWVGALAPAGETGQEPF